MRTPSAEIREVARTVWTSFGLEVDEVGEGPASPLVEMVGCVQISGTWAGGVEIRCPVPLARAAAAAMTMTDEAAIDDEILRDAFAEIVNMIGGGVKSAIGGALTLSLPIVVTGREFTMTVRNTVVCDRVYLRSSGAVLTVTLFSQEK